MARYTIGIDVGGTFTDLVCVGPRGHVKTSKAATTPDNQADGMLAAIELLAKELELTPKALLKDTDLIVHGTTIATNMFLEWNGAKAFMLTTRGLRDIVDIRRNIKEGAFDLRIPPPHPIIPRGRRIPITERVNFAGDVLTALAEHEVRDAAGRLGEEGAEALSVCYLFSFVNPNHELRSRDIVREILPELHISLSHEVLPRVREYERFSTTAVDAYVAPRLRRYLSGLQDRLRDAGFRGDLLIMKSNGGVTEVERSRKVLGVELVASGPAGGVVAAAHLGSEAGYPNIIAMDMGGTSFDVSLVEGATPRVGSDGWVSRHRVALDMIDVTSIGAGGGSIAWVDYGGALRIGPQSAGAKPGPACYGNGGKLPTVTDADLVLGYISPDSFLGGRVTLDVAAARNAIETQVAVPLRMSMTDASLAMFRIVNHNMANALRLVTIARGRDPRGFAMMAFGGGGPIHAGALVDDLGISTILIPKGLAPVFCALGDVLSNIRESTSRGFFVRGSVDCASMSAAFRGLIQQAEADIGAKALALPGRVDRFVNMRYVGQSHEVTVPVSGGPESLSEADWTSTIASFHRLHAEQYSFNRPLAPTEVIGLQIDRWAFRQKPATARASKGHESRTDAGPIKGTRQVLMSSSRGYEEVPVVDGRLLNTGFRISGPSIIEEQHTSIVIFRGQSLVLNDTGFYVVTRDVAADAVG